MLTPRSGQTAAGSAARQRPDERDRMDAGPADAEAGTAVEIGSARGDGKEKRLELSAWRSA
jgi:hypothetical protein